MTTIQATGLHKSYDSTPVLNGIELAVVQTLVFTLLAMVYIQSAVDHGHGDEGHDPQEHDHHDAKAAA